jgi:hypothetical protein
MNHNISQLLIVGDSNSSVFLNKVKRRINCIVIFPLNGSIDLLTLN